MIDILIRYLGIKTKLLNNIDSVISKEIDTGCVLDLFSGSTIVAQKMMDRYTVYTNDIQKYSYVVSQATVVLDPKFDYSSLSVEKVLESQFFKENIQYLSKVWDEPLRYETQLLGKLNADIENADALREFKHYYENAPYVFGFDETAIPRCFSGMQEVYSVEKYRALKEDKQNNPYMLFTLNYAMPYFSLRQAIFVDSYRYAIDRMLQTNAIGQTEHYVHLSFLIYLLNNIVTSVGDHFAQPQQFKVSDENKLKREVAKIIKKKSLDLIKCLQDKCDEFRKINTAKLNNNKAYCDDYINVLQDRDVIDNVDLIYIDPPYTNAHYSRFYHILETLVAYDYPELEYFGRYRNDRFQSPFCIKSEALREFDRMIDACSRIKKIVVISYSDTKQCIITKEQLLAICNKYYSSVTLEEQDYLYRNFGQKPNRVQGTELLIVCR